MSFECRANAGLNICPLVLVVCIGSCSFGLAFANASELPLGSEIPKPEARFVLESMWHARSLVVSAHAEISVAFEGLGEGDSVTNDDSIDYTLYCDLVSERFRVDRRSSAITWQFVQRPEWLLVHPSTSAVISRYAPDFIIPWEEAVIIDPRVIGVTHRDGVCGLMLNELHGYFPDDKATVRKIDEGKFVIIWETMSEQYPELTTVTRLWCAEQIGFAPYRVEQISGLNGRFPPKPDLSSDTSYHEIDGVFVPIKSVFETRRNGQEQPLETWTIRWHKINSDDIGESVFTAKGLDAPGGTIVADARLGGTSVIEFVIERDGVDDLPGGPPKILGEGGLKGSHNSSFWLLANAAVVVALFVLIILKFRSRQA